MILGTYRLRCTGIPRTRQKAFRVRGGAPSAAMLAVLLILATGPFLEAEAGSILVDAADLVPDAGDCGGKTNACNTIQAGIDAADAGGKIKIKKGLYTEEVVIGTADLSIKGSGKDSVIIDAEIAAAPATCVGDPSRTVFAGDDGADPGPCGQFDNTDQVSCEGAWARDVEGTAVSCYWDGGTACNECDAENTGACVNECVLCADATRTVFAGQASQPCHAYDGVQATCETAWAINQNGDSVSCWWDADANSCEGCGPNNQDSGECSNTCSEDESVVTITAPGVRLRRVFVRNGSADGILVEDTAAGTVLEGVSVRGAQDNCVRIEADGTTVSKSNLVGCGEHAIRGAYSEMGDPSVLHDVTISRNFLSLCNSGCIDIDGSNSTIESNTIQVAVNGDCIDLEGNDAVVIGNKIGPCDGYGLEVTGDRFLVSDNESFATDSDAYDLACDACMGASITDNVARDVGNDDGGFTIRADTPGLVVDGNEAVRVSDEGFEIFGEGVIFRNNRAADSGGDNYEPCFDINGTDHVLEGNSARNCHDDGYDLGGSGHELTGNEAVGNQGDGFDVEPEAENLVLVGNTATGNIGMGFEVSSGALMTALEDNVASGNGIDLCDEGTGTTSVGNTVATSSMFCAVGD